MSAQRTTPCDRCDARTAAHSMPVVLTVAKGGNELEDLGFDLCVKCQEYLIGEIKAEDAPDRSEYVGAPEVADVAGELARLSSVLEQSSKDLQGMYDTDDSE